MINQTRDVIERVVNLDSVRQELADLNGLKPTKITVSTTSKDYRCSHCVTAIGVGREVLWIRTVEDDQFVPDMFISGSSWKAKPWHRLCWDRWEYAVDQHRMRLERLLGEDHHELRSI